MQNLSSNNNIPLVVDLDGTLIKKDLLYEGLKLLLRKNPFYIFTCFQWLLKGKINFKYKLFKKVKIEMSKIPVNENVLHFIKEEKKLGKRVILATASLQSMAEEIARIYPFFDKTYGTKGDKNLKGKNKLDLLVNLYGKKKFDYIGNSFSDLVIFKSCRFAYLVNTSKSLRNKTNKVADLKEIPY
jgi:phosphoserine phosphatase